MLIIIDYVMLIIVESRWQVWYMMLLILVFQVFCMFEIFLEKFEVFIVKKVNAKVHIIEISYQVKFIKLFIKGTIQNH